MGQVSRIIIHGILQSIVDLSQLGWKLEQKDCESDDAVLEI